MHELSLSNAVVNANGGPAVGCKKVLDLELVRVRSLKSEAKEPAIVLEDVHGATVQSCSAAQGSTALLQLKGEGNQDVTLALNRVSKRTQEVVFSDGASEQAVVKRI